MTRNTHHKDEEVLCNRPTLDICKETFISKDKASSTFWAVFVFIMLIYGSAIAWALAKNTQLAALETKSNYQEVQINQLINIKGDLDSITKWTKPTNK